MKTKFSNGGGFQESILLKLFLIGVLVMVLLVPSVMIQHLVTERQQRQKEVTDDISEKWSGAQQVAGPILVVPYTQMTSETDSVGRHRPVAREHLLYVLPDRLSITGNVDADILHRRIFDAVVYRTELAITGHFEPDDLQKLGLREDAIQWSRARLMVGLSDLRGLKVDPRFVINGRAIPSETGDAGMPFNTGVFATPGLTADTRNFDFSFRISMNGSRQLSFLHLGKQTRVVLKGNWPTPKYEGRVLPDKRTLHGAQFTADWTLLGYNRPFPQQWTDKQVDLADSAKLSAAAFGVSLLLPVDPYQKNMRATKYAILVVLLTFVALFFTELIGKYRFHFLHYLLVGAAMVIYYTLLLSFSEQVGFAIAYLIASVATVVLVSVFVASLTRWRSVAPVFAATLSSFYGFIYMIIQLEDFALLAGSLGLFVIIGVLMFVTSKMRLAAVGDDQTD